MQMPQININILLYDNWPEIRSEIVKALWGTHYHQINKDTTAYEILGKNSRFGLIDFLTFFPLVSMGLSVMALKANTLTNAALKYEGALWPANYVLAAGSDIAAMLIWPAFFLLEALRFLTMVILSIPFLAISVLMVPALRLGYQAGIKLGFYREESDEKKRGFYPPAYGENFKMTNLFPGFKTFNQLEIINHNHQSKISP